MQSLRGQKGPSYRPWSSPGLSAGGVASSAAGTQVLAGTGAGPWDASGSSLQATRAGQRSRALPGQPRVAASSRPQTQASGFWRGSRLKADPERAGSCWHALGLALSPASPLGSQWSAAPPWGCAARHELVRRSVMLAWWLRCLLAQLVQSWLWQLAPASGQWVPGRQGNCGGAGLTPGCCSRGEGAGPTPAAAPDGLLQAMGELAVRTIIQLSECLLNGASVAAWSQGPGWLEAVVSPQSAVDRDVCFVYLWVQLRRPELSSCSCGVMSCLEPQGRF